MRCLMTLFFAALGLVALGLGGFFLYTAFIESPETRTVTLGGASQTQLAIAEHQTDDPANLNIVVVADGNVSSTQNFGGVVADEAILTDLARRDPDEAIAVAQIDPDIRTQADVQAVEVAAGTTDIQSNVVAKNEILTADSEVQVFALSTGGEGVRGTSTPNFGFDEGQGGMIPLPTEQRVVEFEWPKQFRSGESASVRVTLKVLPTGQIQVSSPEIPSNALIATPIVLTDCHDNYYAEVEGRIFAPEFTVENVTSTTQTVQRGSDTTWRWTMTPKKDGVFVFTVVLNLRWFPRQSSNPPADQCLSLARQGVLTIWGQPVQVEVNKVFGLITIPQASIAGTVLAVIGFLGQIPLVTEIASNILEKRMERSAERRRQRRAEKRRR